MDKRGRKQIRRCPTCGIILNDTVRVDRMLADADEALERFYNKLKKKKK
tara:strand:+ start:281 stop:427 length:147 start_codon:yes stop_codon:yes gene_type:complete